MRPTNEPDPVVSVTVAEDVLVSPHVTVAVCVSFVPASLNDALTLTALASGTWPVGALSAPSHGRGIAER